MSIPDADTPSLPQRRSLHLDPPPARGRQIRLRVRRRTLVAGPDPRDHPHLRHLHAVQSERREPRQRRGREVMAGGSQGVQEAGAGVREGEYRRGLEFAGSVC